MILIELEKYQVEITLRIICQNFIVYGTEMVSIHTFKNKLLEYYPEDKYLLPDIDYDDYTYYINDQINQNNPRYYSDDDLDYRDARGSVLLISPENSDSE